MEKIALYAGTDVLANKKELERVYNQSFNNNRGATKVQCDFTNSATPPIFEREFDNSLEGKVNGYIDLMDDPTYGISAKFDSNGYITSLSYIDHENGNTEKYNYINVDIDGDGEIDSILDSHRFTNAYNRETIETEYDYDENYNLTGSTTTSSRNGKFTQYTRQDTDGDGINDYEVTYWQDGTSVKSKTQQKPNGDYSTAMFDKDGNLTQIETYSNETGMHYVLTTDPASGQQFQISWQNGNQDDIKYEMRKKDSFVELTQEEYQFELENVGNNWFQKMYNKYFN